MALTPEQRRKNLRLGLVLASVAFVFLAGFVAKAILFGL
ncbi:MAG TPA: cytochrome oxidase small assembly protein [Burkholderiaceae bacterium]